MDKAPKKEVATIKEEEQQQKESIAK